ncbi:L-type lectin-domain containing receptor kinase IX.1 [Manihot esculenta]|uniref:Uncharacterized protein n=4 Tax=Manihot esculenta TaxID=3983 RepID=A0ACB7HE77_MANES|nr:L-type lectin-domain containing receptor kinase IX.1 [Manihot esculenta]KAG8650475.1 hypothetical protein MANES_07G045800v8 [Manihot esculenta]KAG8650476.1 hypothetical protein MANES_07G045800v8 [Manihot esculenta]KAG8650477.1 hypothetical protein MANES_07G045800v8 [Manihot esculenta]OAY45263.1 hypothetical protein MANES_07G045800v8 [Manihot esculenta]
MLKIQILLNLCIVIFSFPITLNASTSSLNFNFTSFSSSDPQIFTERDANVTEGEIELTLIYPSKETSARYGRATYAEPLHLWDKASGNLTNFTTQFSFLIDSRGSHKYGDGITFFMAPNGSRMPANVKGSGGIGLARSNSDAVNPKVNKFVAVEFDTYQNDWDPPYDHIGFNVNSMVSLVNRTWRSGARTGSKTDVRIRYDSNKKSLRVNFSFLDRDNETIKYGYKSADIDMAEYLPEWVTFGFSCSTGNPNQSNRIISWDFTSSSEIVENGNREVPSDPVVRKERKEKTALVIGLISGACAFVVIVGFITLCLRMKKKKVKKPDDFLISMSFGDDFRNGTSPRSFAYQELANATSNFSETMKLGAGGFGAVYRGFLKDLNSFIAVKRVSKISEQGIKEYRSEVKVISRLRHKNLVKLIGWCHEKELLLVYEFMPNGSLESHLFKVNKSLLTWDLRFKIAQGLASALLYLHQEGDQCVLHRDIKSSNVLLDSSFNSKLGDFGLARLVDHRKGSQTTIPAGTAGYMAPECLTTGKVSKESDVYSFGVVALEIACGRRAVELKLEQGQIKIVEFVWKLYGMGKLLEAADPKLCRDFDEQQMERLMKIGLWCAHPDPILRPSTWEVANVLLNFEAVLPTLPSEMPPLAYHAFPNLSSAYSYTSSDGSRISNGQQSA